MFRKAFSIFFSINFILVMLLLLVAVNFKFALLDPEKIKSYAEDSGVYNLANGYIKDELVKANKVDLTNGQALESIDSAFSTEKIKKFMDDTIDKLFIAIKDPAPNNLQFNVSYETSTDALPTIPAYERTVNMQNNQVFLVITKIDIIIFSLATLSLILLALMLLCNRDIFERFSSAGASLIFLGLAIGSAYYAAARWSPLLVDQLVSGSNFVKDVMLINGSKKILSSALDAQLYYYTIEAIILFFSGVILGYFSKVTKKEDPLDPKTPNLEKVY